MSALRAQIRKRLIGALGAGLLLGSLVTVSSASPANADLGCVPGGVHILFARGSGAGFDSAEAVTFKQTVESSLGSIPSNWAQLGDLDEDHILQADREYPAAGGIYWWDHPGYGPSVALGREELILYLNHRYSPAGRNCQNEALVLGGYSQGADVIGDALQDPYLNANVLDNIGFVAMYGDPTFSNGGTNRCLWPSDNPRKPWAKGTADCVSANVPITQRTPYARPELELRTGSWCDQGDGLCAHNIASLPGSHVSAYANTWISASAPEIAHAAWLKTMQLNSPPPVPPSPSYPTEVGSPKLAATRNQNGRLALFYIGTDYNIYYQYQLSPGGWWGAEHRINAHAKGIAVTTSADGRIEIFYIGGDNSVVHVYQTSPNSHAWSAEEYFGTSVRAITAARNGAGRLEIATVDWNNQIHVRQQGSPNSWGGTNWQHLPAVALDIAMTTASDGRNELFYVGGNGSLMHRWETSVGGAWSGEEGFTAGIAKVAASRNQDGRLEVFAIGPNNQLQNKWQWQPNTPWSTGWNNLVGVATQITSAVNADGRIELFYTIGNNTIWHQWQNNPGAGQGWSAQSQMYGRVSA